MSFPQTSHVQGCHYKGPGAGSLRAWEGRGGGEGVLPYMGYIGMCFIKINFRDRSLFIRGGDG